MAQANPNPPSIRQVPPPGGALPDLNMQVPQTVSEPAPAQPTVQQAVPPAPAPQPVQPAPAQQPLSNPVWDINAWQKEQVSRWTARENELKARLQAQEKELADSRARLAEYDKVQQEAQLQNLVNVDLDNLDYIDNDTAKEIQDKLIAPTIQRVLEATTARINQVNSVAQNAYSSSNNEFKHWQEQQAWEKRAQTNARITAAHPDVDDILNSMAYKEFIAQNVPGTFVTRGSQIAAAYSADNADYVIDSLNQFKAGQPTLESVASAPMNQVNPVATQPAGDSTTYSYEQLSDWKQAFDSHEIDQAEYNRRVADFKRAAAEGRVA